MDIRFYLWLHWRTPGKTRNKAELNPNDSESEAVSQHLKHAPFGLLCNWPGLSESLKPSLHNHQNQPHSVSYCSILFCITILHSQCFTPHVRTPSSPPMRYLIQVLQCSDDHLLCWVTKMHPKTDEHMSVNLKTRTSGCGWLWLAMAGGRSRLHQHSTVIRSGCKPLAGTHNER
jgi:hypothetical protein